MSGSQGEHEAHEAHEAEHEDFKGSPQLFLRASFVSFVAFVFQRVDTAVKGDWFDSQRR